MTVGEQRAMKLLYDACAEFVRKVEKGKARSTRSYAQMKEAMAVHDALKDRD